MKYEHKLTLIELGFLIFLALTIFVWAADEPLTPECAPSGTIC